MEKLCFKWKTGQLKFREFPENMKSAVNLAKKQLPLVGGGSPAGCGHNKFLLEVIKLALANLINRSWKFARLIAMFHYEKRELSIYRILILFFSWTLNELEVEFFSSAIIQFNEGKSRIWLAVEWGGVGSTISSQGGTHEAELGQPLNCAKLSQEENSSLLTTVRTQCSTVQSCKKNQWLFWEVSHHCSYSTESISTELTRHGSTRN